LNASEFRAAVEGLGFEPSGDGVYCNGRHRVNMAGVKISADQAGQHVYEETFEQVKASLERPEVSISYREPHVRDKSIHQERIEQFMLGCKQVVPMVPTVPDQKVRLLRARLILEEALETVEALGFRLYTKAGRSYLSFGDFQFSPEVDPNLVEIADGCADLSVVTYGTLSACGIADESVVFAVDENNLEKLEKGTVDEHGKLVKPKDHQPPDIEKILKEQGWKSGP